MGTTVVTREIVGMAIAAAGRDREAPSSLHTFTVEQYMALEIPERTELLEGLIYDLSPKNAPHFNVVLKLTESLVPALLGSKVQACFEQPIAVSGWTGPNAPEIDVAVIARKRYTQTPTASDAIAFLEVSDTTYARDRNLKTPLYVNAGIPSYIVVLALRQVEYYGSVDDLALSHGVVFRAGDTFEIAGVTIDVAALFDGTSDSSAE